MYDYTKLIDRKLDFTLETAAISKDSHITQRRTALSPESPSPKL